MPSQFHIIHFHYVSFCEQYLWLILNEVVCFPSTNLGAFKSVYETNFFYLIGGAFQNDEEWHLCLL